MLLCVCLVIEHSGRQIVAGKKKVAHEAQQGVSLHSDHILTSTVILLPHKTTAI